MKRSYQRHSGEGQLGVLGNANDIGVAATDGPVRASRRWEHAAQSA